jgi:hypothetical protein
MPNALAEQMTEGSSLFEPSWQTAAPEVSLSMDDERRRRQVQLGRGEVLLTVEGSDFPSWLDDALRALNAASALPANWDSYGARPVNQRTLEHALQILTRIMNDSFPAPEILATSHGGIQFLWNARKRELKVAVNAPYRGEYYYFDENKNDEEEEPFSLELDGIVRRLNDFIA